MENPQNEPPDASTVPEVSPPQPPSPREPEPPRKTRKAKRFSALVLAAILLVGLIGGGLLGFSLSYATFNGRIGDLQAQLQNLPPTNVTYVSYPNATYVLTENVSLAALYSQVRPSVVVIQDFVPQYSIFGGFLVGYTQQQGSGFVTLVGSNPVVVTNNHVIQNSVNVTVTFANGDSYPSRVLGADPQADLAVLALDGESADFQPVTLVSSSNLQVGDPVVAVGSPYGLSGTLTTGIVSALGRTITETDGTQNINIPDVIQTSTAINPGNSGGPLINYRGEVVGITTAAVSNSEGLGFVIPSDTILREVSSLVKNGVYDQHPTINAAGTDMTYQIAQAVGTNVTYGWLVETVGAMNGLIGGSTRVTVLGSQIITGGDIIIGINGTRIANTDDLLSYLERHTLPGQTVDFTAIRDGQTRVVSVTIGKL
ncbi:MAG: S1C family serine protease [Candidatus Bathyarchaeia archaeon]